MKLAVTIGKFDGVHRGHVELMQKTRHLAKAMGAMPCAYTFYSALGNGPGLIVELKKRGELIKQQGLEPVFVEFTKEFLALSPEEFVKSLCKAHDVACVVTGEDFRFGKNAAGDINALAMFGKRYGFKTAVVNKLLLNDVEISSTNIKNAIAAGDFELVNAQLGYNHCYEGTVIRNMGIGSELAFPTINITIKKQLQVPKEGVYAAYIVNGNERYPSAAYYGTRPTVNGTVPMLEAHSLVHCGDLYDRQVLIELVKYLRADVKFENKDQLQAQIATDVANCHQIL